MWKITRAGLRTQLLSTRRRKKILTMTMMVISSHFTATYGQFNDCYFIYRHRGGHCINCVLVFALFTIILLLRTVRWLFILWSIGPQKLKQAKLGQFSIFSLQNWTIVCLNHPYNGLVSFDCTDLSSDSLKKERLCLQIVLGQTWFEFHCTSYFLPCTHFIVIRIGRASPP